MRPFVVAAFAFPLALAAQAAQDPAALADWKAKHAKALTAYEAAHAKRRASMEKQLSGINGAEEAYRTLQRDEFGKNDNVYMDPGYRARMKDERYHLFQKDDSSAAEHITVRRANEPDAALASFANRRVVIMAVLVETDSAVRLAAEEVRYARMAYDRLKMADDPTQPVDVRSKYRSNLDARDKYVRFARARQDFHVDHAKALRLEQTELEKQFAAAKAVSKTP